MDWLGRTDTALGSIIFMSTWQSVGPHMVIWLPGLLTISLVDPPGLAGRSRAEILATEPLILPTPDPALRASFDALAERLGVVPRIAAAADDMAMLRLLARAGAGLAVITPIVVQEELVAGTLAGLARLEGIAESFEAVTLQRRFANPLVAEILDAFSLGER